MAIYVYNTTTGALQSWIPGSITIAQAQASNQLASNATLAANGFSAVDGLPSLDATHVWDTATHTVDTVTAPTPAAPMPTYFFLLRFTPAEYAAIGASIDQQVMQWWEAIRGTRITDVSDQTIITNMQHISSLGLVTSARVVTILTTPTSAPSSQTG